jgi:hypothetical protein
LDRKLKVYRNASGKAAFSDTSEPSYPALNGTNMLENRCARQDQRIDAGRPAMPWSKLPLVFRFDPLFAIYQGRWVQAFQTAPIIGRPL